MSLRVAMVGLRAPGAEGGVENVVAQLGPRLVGLGCEVTVFCRQRYNSSGRSYRGMRLVDVPTVYTKHLEALVHTSLAVPLALWKRGAFDVLHVHAAGPALLSFLPRLCALPTVATIHGLDWRRDKWGLAARAALRTGAFAAGAFPHALITISEETTSFFAHRAHKVVRIPNGVTPIPASPLEAAEVPGIRPGFVLFLGRLVPEKAVDVLVRAHRVAATGRQLVVTGGDGNMPAYGAKLRALAGPDVLFTGPRFGPAKAALLHHAAAVAFPSRLEGLPLGVLEAMACARPVLVSDIPPHRELVPDGRFGVRLPLDDTEAWAHALRRLDHDDLAPIGMQARDHVLTRYSWDPIAERTLGVYRTAMARAGHAPVAGRAGAGIGSAR